MTYKICQTIFSTNRIPYLTRTLNSQKLLDFTGCEVTKIFFDDYPRDRNDRYIEIVAKTYNYNNVVLHTENLGITRTWQELFDYIKQNNFDYIWHQEDDAEICAPVKILQIINILETYPEFSQIQLKRNNWYDHETTPIGPKDTDLIHGGYRVERGNPYFWMMASLYPAWIAQKYNLIMELGMPSEASLAHFMLRHNGSMSGLLKTQQGDIMVNHFGDYTRGRKVVPGDLGYQNFAHFDPDKNYDSKHGHIIE